MRPLGEEGRADFEPMSKQRKKGSGKAPIYREGKRERFDRCADKRGEEGDQGRGEEGRCRCCSPAPQGRKKSHRDRAHHQEGEKKKNDWFCASEGEKTSTARATPAGRDGDTGAGQKGKAMRVVNSIKGKMWGGARGHAEHVERGGGGHNVLN